MGSRSARRRAARRDRRKAKESGWTRAPKTTKKVGHGPSGVDDVAAPSKPDAAEVEEKKAAKIRKREEIAEKHARVFGPEPESPFSKIED